MAKIQIDIPDEEHKRFRQQAERDAVTLSEWMIKAAQLHLNSRGLLKEHKQGRRFKSEAEIREFFRLCDELTAEEGSGRKVHEEGRIHEPFATTEPFKSAEELEAFFRYCDTLDGPDREPDWEEHLKVINESKMSGWKSV